MVAGLQPRPGHLIPSINYSCPTINKNPENTSTLLSYFSSVPILNMEKIDDFFSPEALRLLDGPDIDCETLFPPEGLVVDQEPTTTLPQHEPRMNGGDNHSNQAFSRPSTDIFGQRANPKRKRAKFDIKAREKVAAVRRKGACLRCRMLKLPVRAPAVDLQLVNDQRIVLRDQALHFMHP